MKHLNVIIFAILAVACIVYCTLYRHFQRENHVAEVQESWEAIACVSVVYTILVMSGIVFALLSIVSKL